MRNKKVLHLSLMLCIFCIGSVFAAEDWILEDTAVPADVDQKTILHIKIPARYAIGTGSDSGASIKLIDPVSGSIGESGITGRLDGRIDAFLDTGRYRLIINGDKRDKNPVKIQIKRFVRYSDKQPLPGLEIQSSSLKDYEIRDYWFTMKSAGKIHVEAAGRSLDDMRLWLNDSWLTADKPVRSISHTQSGQSLQVCRLTVHCPKGTHRLSLYGGEPLIWSSGGDNYPLYIRSGIPKFEFAGVYPGTVSIFGEDLFYVSPGAEFFRLESNALNTGITVRNYDEDSLYPWELDDARLITDKNKQWAEWKTRNRDTAKIFRISGSTGSPYYVRWFPIKPSNNTMLNYDGKYDIGLFLGGEPCDYPLLNGLIIERARTSRGSNRIIARSTVSVGADTAFARRFNIDNYASLFVDFAEAGDYTISSRGTPARFTLEPFMLVYPGDYVKPLPSSFNSVVNTAANLYILTILADKPGSMDLMISRGNESAQWQDADFEPGAFDSWVEFLGLELSRDHRYQLVTNFTGSTQGYFAVESKEPENIETSILLPHEVTGNPGVVKQISPPEMKFGKPVTVQLASSSTGLVGMEVTQPGVYQIETHGMLRSKCSLRSLMRTQLKGLRVRGNGDNTVLRQYLTPGDYFVEISASHGERGLVDVTAVKLGENHLGQMAPWDTVRCDLSENTIPIIKMNVTEENKYRITDSPNSILLRLEDEEGWPISIQEGGIYNQQMDPGLYNLVQIASPYIHASKLHFRTKSELKPVSGAGPHKLDLSKGGHGFWDQTTDSGEDHVWIVDLDAETTLTLTLSKGWEGKLISTETQSGSMKLAEGVPFVKKLDSGVYELSVHPVIPDNMKPYHISVKSDPMISGTNQTIQCPGHVKFCVGADNMDSAIVLQLDSPADTRAVLVYPRSDSTRPIKVSDDIPGDWNPNFVIFSDVSGSYSEADTYRLNVESVSSQSSSCKVNFLVPEVEIKSIPISGKQNFRTAGKLLKLIPDETLSNGFWVVSAKSEGLFAMSGSDGIANNHVSIVPMDADTSVKLWDIDNRRINIDVSTDIIIPSRTAEQSNTVLWKTILLDGKKISLSSKDINTPGLFEIKCSRKTSPIYFPGDKSKSIYDNPVEAESRIALYSILPIDGEAPAVTINRFVLNQNRLETETSVDGIVDIELNENQTGLIQMKTNCAEKIQQKTLKYGPGGSYQLNLRREFPEPMMEERIKIHLSVFDETSIKIQDSSIGTAYLNPGEVVGILPVDRCRRLSVSMGVNLAAFDDNGFLVPAESTVINGHKKILVYNMGSEVSGIGWTTKPNEITKLESLPAVDGKGSEIFLGSAQLQPFKFYLPETRTVGVAIKCTTGHVRARIVDAMGHVTGARLDDAKGLVINTRLNAGYYILEVFLPPGAPPSLIQPHFVLDKPENLILFGEKE